DNSEGRSDRSVAFAKADAGKPLPAAARAHDDGITILEEAARLARGERHRTTAAGRELEQASEPVLGGRGDRAGAEQIARAQVAAAAAVMGDELRDRPVEMARVADCQPLRRKAFGLETRCEQKHLEVDIEGSFCLVRRVEEIR